MSSARINFLVRRHRNERYTIWRYIRLIALFLFHRKHILQIYIIPVNTIYIFIKSITKRYVNLFIKNYLSSNSIIFLLIMRHDLYNVIIKKKKEKYQKLQLHSESKFCNQRNEILKPTYLGNFSRR